MRHQPRMVGAAGRSVAAYGSVWSSGMCARRVVGAATLGREVEARGTVSSRGARAGLATTAPTGAALDKDRAELLSATSTELLSLYRRQLRLLQKWPKDEDRDGRNLHDFMNRRVRLEYRRRRELLEETPTAQLADVRTVLVSHAEGQQRALMELFTGAHKHLYPLSATMDRAVESRERMRKILSTEHQKKNVAKQDGLITMVIKRVFPQKKGASPES